MVTLEGVNAKIQRAQDEIERLTKDIADSCEAATFVIFGRVARQMSATKYGYFEARHRLFQ